jgi:hypothetical protein
MFGRRLVAWQLTALLAGCATAAAEEPAPRPETRGNAALLYWQAFAQLSELPPTERDVIDWYFKKDRAPAKVRQRVFQKTAEAATTIYRAVRMPRCDWDEDVTQGTAPLLPRVAMCRSLGRFLAFRAKQEFEQGNPRAAMHDLLAGFTLARHTAADDTIVGALVGLAIEGIFEGEGVEHLQQMDPAALDALQSGLDRIPPRPTWKAILAQDKRRLDEWLIPQFAATGDPDAWKATLRRMYPDEPPVERVEKKAPPRSPKGKPESPKTQREARPMWRRASDLIERFGTREALVQHLKEGHKLLDEFAQFPFEPGKISEPLMAKIEELWRRSPLFDEYCSLNPASYRATCRAAVQFQLLRAAIAVQRRGPEAIKDYPDPSGVGPFEYRKRKDGFELVSQFRHPISGYERFSVKVGPLAEGEHRFW